MANETRYDVIVIGSGAASKITRPAASKGFKVAIIERGPLGGTCLNRGCIPSKMLIHPADVVSEIRGAAKFNIHVPCVEQLTVDKAKLVTRVCESIDADSASIVPLLENHPGVTLYRGDATFVGPKKVQVNGKILVGDKIFVVAGCKASIPDLPGLQGTPYITYAEALRDKTAPKTLLVIGGGYIAMELGYYYSRTGSTVDFLVRSRMLNAEDEEVRDHFEKLFEAEHPGRIHFGEVPTKVSYSPGQKLFTVETKHKTTGAVQTRTAESLFVATGATGVKVDKRGFIVVDNAFRTSQEGIYAFGDIIGRHLFRHTANYEGEWVFNSVFVDQSLAAKGIDYPPVPHAVFTHPQVGGVGLTTEKAIERFGGADKIVVGRCDYEDVAMGQALLAEEGTFLKLIFEKASRKLVGAHGVGHEISTMIHMCIAYCKMGATLEDMLDTIYIHPALPEIVRNAARDAKEAFDG
ncbi:mercuric reductase [Polychytrium aggregatum]|uniref:mercuric reductase n=1 Tax=Polychytrium aggregatum TaxID=110093 RepID=UPI0022FE5A04|nr:mercuric reductase [Polychytrium aggregatum]KAI9207996.1 mercuric reductase [Polychytrium aggregatum]